VLHDIKGNFSGSFSIITNIERQKAKEFSLKQQQEEQSALYDHIFENTRVPMLKIDFSEVITLLEEKKRRRVKNFSAYLEKHQEFLIHLIESVLVTQANPAALKLFQVENIEALREMFLLFVLPETLDFFRYCFRKLAAKEHSFRRETKVADAEGETVPVFADLSVPPKRDGYRDTLLTLTDLREGEERAIRPRDPADAGESRYKAILSALPEAVVVCDANRNVIHVSQKALQLFGYDDEKKVLGKPILSWVDPADHDRAIENIKMVFAGRSVPSRYLLVNQDHEKFPAEIKSSIVTEPDSRKKNMISFIRKIDE
jgi:PAS domain S-box-containing protein